MSKFLVFQVCTNLGSFGSENAVWYYRVSDAYPQISQVVGLLAASLGLSRDDLRLQSFYEDYKISLLSLPTKMSKLVDYHTMSTQATLISRREYLSDILFNVAIELSDDSSNPQKEALFSLEDLQKALQKPVFSLYVGRRSCPLCLPPNPQILEAQDLVQAFQAYFAKYQVQDDLIKRLLHLDNANTLKSSRPSQVFDNKSSKSKKLTATCLWVGDSGVSSIENFQTTGKRSCLINSKTRSFSLVPISSAPIQLEV